MSDERSATTEQGRGSTSSAGSAAPGLPRLLGFLVIRSGRKFYDDGCTQAAAAISYYVLFSLFPLLMFTAGVLGLFLTDADLREELVNAVLDFIPLDENEARGDLSRAVDSATGITSGTVGFLGLVAMLWTASSIFGVTRDALNRVFVLGPSRHVIHQKLWDLAMVLAFAPFFVASVAATGALRFARDVTRDLPIFGASDLTDLFWLIMAALLPALLSFIAFFGIYWLVPARRPDPRNLWPGALVAALIFEGSNLLFVLYLSNFTSYNPIFGTLGTIAAFVFWVYLSANVMLFGAEIAASAELISEKKLSSRPSLVPSSRKRSAASKPIPRDSSLG